MAAPNVNANIKAAEAAVPELQDADGSEEISLQDYITEVPPYTEDRMKRIQFFFKKREGKQRERYTYTARGNLEIRNKAGAVEETIPLKAYIPYDTITRETREQNRLDAIGQGETEYEAALATLKAAMEEYKRTDAVQPVLAAQKAVSEADQILSRIRYGSRAAIMIPNPDINDILFDETGGSRKLFRSLYKGDDLRVTRFITLEMPYRSFYGTYTDAPDAEPVEDIEDGLEEVGASESAIRQKLKDGRTARIFFDADDGLNAFLSPFWPVEFTMDSTRYFTAYQAFEVARATDAGKEDIKAALLKTRSPRTMRFITKKFETPAKNSKALWTAIYTAIYSQHPEMKTKLLETTTDALVFADIRKGSSGVGLGERDKAILDPTKWQGENHLGLALESLRYQYREGTVADVARNDAPEESVISKEEQEKAKMGAIIQAKRKFQFKKPGA